MKYEVRFTKLSYGRCEVYATSRKEAEKIGLGKEIDYFDEEITDVTAEAMQTVTEVCQNCMREVELHWDVYDDGYLAYCPYCGDRLMLCDECQHDKDGDSVDDCDYCSETNTCRHSRP